MRSQLQTKVIRNARVPVPRANEGAEETATTAGPCSRAHRKGREPNVCPRLKPHEQVQLLRAVTAAHHAKLNAESEVDPKGTSP